MDVVGLSSEVRIIDPPRRLHSRIWFMLQASHNQCSSCQDFRFVVSARWTVSFFALVQADGHRRRGRGRLSAKVLLRRQWGFQSELRGFYFSSSFLGDALTVMKVTQGQFLSCESLLYFDYSHMAILAWNVRGLGNRETVRALMNSIRKSQSDIVFLSETKQKRRYLEKIKMKMKLEHSFYVEPIGLAGGLALWWSKDFQIKILGHGKYFIDAEVSGRGEPAWFGTFIYGPPYKDQKRDFWEFMKNLRNDYDAKWLVIGDSNVVSCQDEKAGGLPFNPIDANSFLDFLDSRGLIEMPMAGGAFTWSNHRSDDEAILEKLDRVLYSTNWNIAFPKAVALLDIAMGSDHAPTSQPRNSHRFGSKLRRTKFTLLRWSKLRDRVKNLRKNELRRRIQHYQGKQLTREELSESTSCKKELDQMWENEERY
ncbi:hypothetical protein V6N11_081751 [Hibiscus sabdariffa]|uniref:Endonuclease/exonuclease/phosphatase domain-containing protein n=1 Tax=Hibiscus sabdariffa TaxID=183260 RepID=A0ABR2Q731_9ROSI